MVVFRILVSAVESVVRTPHIGKFGMRLVDLFGEETLGRTPALRRRMGGARRRIWKMTICEILLCTFCCFFVASLLLLAIYRRLVGRLARGLGGIPSSRIGIPGPGEMLAISVGGRRFWQSMLRICDFLRLWQAIRRNGLLGLGRHIDRLRQSTMQACQYTSDRQSVVQVLLRQHKEGRRCRSLEGWGQDKEPREAVELGNLGFNVLWKSQLQYRISLKMEGGGR
jgi:hypothetical protein